MGGYGSGPWGWRWTRDTTDDVMSLDIRKLARHPGLQPGAYSYRWTRRGNPFGWIGATIDPDRLDEVILDYTVTIGSHEPRQVRDVIPIARTECTYGGTRPWFVCNGCGRRCAVLYLSIYLFRCRQCGNLAYRSTRESDSERQADRVRRLKQRLGDRYPTPFSVPPRKPKGMHWRTYYRLVEEIDWLEEEQEAELDYAVARWSALTAMLEDLYESAHDVAPGPRGEVFESFCDATIDD